MPHKDSAEIKAKRAKRAKADKAAAKKLKEKKAKAKLLGSGLARGAANTLLKRQEEQRRRLKAIR